MQQTLFTKTSRNSVSPLKAQLLKWIGNKQRFAHEIVSYFPDNYGTYFEPFLGSGAVLGTLAPNKAIASDIFSPLIDIWKTLQESPESLKDWYAKRWTKMTTGKKIDEYNKIRVSYNHNPNGADLLALSRACYGGVVRFRQSDGHMSTPCGIHNPMPPESFAERVDIWHERTKGTKFTLSGYEDSMEKAKPGDLIYCDPPYSYSQSILYGAQTFRLEDLFKMIEKCKRRGVFVALSIDGTKKSGSSSCDISIPKGLFKQEVFVNCGRSMLRRFQMQGKSLETEVVSDRLLLTY
jgi:DNA adenine methylase